MQSSKLVEVVPLLSTFIHRDVWGLQLRGLTMVPVSCSRPCTTLLLKLLLLLLLLEEEKLVVVGVLLKMLKK